MSDLPDQPSAIATSSGPALAPQTTPSHKRSPLKKKRWWTLALAVLVLAWAVLTHSRVTRHLVIPRIEAMLNATIEGGEVSVGLNGVVRITDATLRAPGIEGTAGALFEVKRLKARPNWSRLLGIGGSSTPLLSRVELTEPTARLSQSVDDNTLNFAAIKLPSPQGGSVEVPELIVTRGTIELGEHRKDRNGSTVYTPLKRIDIDGTLKPAADVAQGVYEVVLTQIAGKPDAGVGPLAVPGSMFDVRGRVGEHSVTLSMRGFNLDDWPASSIPTPVRDVFEFIDLRGRIRQTDVTYDEKTGVHASIDLEDVGVNLPVRATDTPLEGPVAPAPPMRMSRVNGSITLDPEGISAQLNGMLEDLPYKVSMRFDGTKVDSAFVCDFECQEFALQENPQILRFAPPLVKYRLATFSNPTAVVSTRAHVTRGPPVNGVPGDVRVSGTLQFRDGVAAYERFPYKFSNLSGSVRFDENTIEILRVEGVSPNGAQVIAHAFISPLTDAAKVEVSVIAKGVPIDGTLADAMGPGRRKLVTEITSSSQYARLLESGVVISPEQGEKNARELNALKAELLRASPAVAQEMEPRIAELTRLSNVPAFALGGKGDVDIQVHRAEGWEAQWSETIDVRLGTIGVLPDRFPLPVIAEGVNVLIDGETVKVQGGTYRGVSGGTATVSATMRYPSNDNPDIDPLPQVHVEARAIPSDDRLIGAVVGAIRRAARPPPAPNDALTGAPTNAPLDATTNSSGSDRWVDGVMHGLGLRGTLDATADIFSNEFGTGVEALARVDQLTSTPTGASSPIIDQIAGTVAITDETVSLDFTGRLGAREGDSVGRIQAQVAAREPAADFVGPPPPYRWTALLDAAALDAEVVVEPVIELFSSQVAGTMRELRRAYQPAGLADVSATVAGGGLVGTRSNVEASRLDGITIDLYDGRLSVNESQGVARVVTNTDSDGLAVEFEGFRADAFFDDEASGVLTVDGRVSDLGQGPATGTLGERGELTIGLVGARFESLLTDRAVHAQTSQSVQDFVAKSQPTGEFDIWLSPRKVKGETWAVRGTLSPRSLELTLDGGRSAFETMTGEIEFDGSTHGTFRDVAGESRGDGTPWSFVSNGSWIVQDSGTLSVQAQLSGEASGLPPTLLAVLPPAVTSTMKGLSLALGGRLVMPKATLRIDDDASVGGKAVRFDGSLSVHDLGLDVGVPIRRATGLMDFSVDSPAHGTPKYELWSLLDSFTLANVGMTNGRIRVSGEDGKVFVPLVSADCYGGRMVGSLQAFPAPAVTPGAALTTRQGSRGTYETSMTFSGVRFAPVLRDMGADTDQVGPPAPNASDDGSRGVMDAHVSLAGEIGDDDTRRGRGSLQIGGGSVLRLPLMLPLVQVSNLQFPTEERLNLATGDFYITGPRVVFEDLSVFSENVQIFGYGTATWPAMDLNLRFNSRSISRIPLVSWLVESVRDQFISTRIAGTLKNPEVSSIPLAGASDLFSRVFDTQSAEERAMADIERRAARARDRVRTVAPRLGTSPEPSPIEH